MIASLLGGIGIGLIGAYLHWPLYLIAIVAFLWGVLIGEGQRK
jgi:uncharacterized integral membrane protein